MGSNEMKKWFLVLLASLLLPPLLHLYSSYIIASKTNGISRDLDLLAETQQISLNLSQLIASGQAYLISFDKGHMEKFNQASISVIKKELDLYHQVSSQDVKNELKKLVVLTEDYVAFMQHEVANVVQNRMTEEYRQVLQDRYNTLILNLQSTSSTINLLLENTLRNDSSTILIFQKAFAVLSFFFILIPMIILFVGARHMVFPAFIRYQQLGRATDISRDAVLTIDSGGKITGANPAALKLFNLELKEIAGRHLEEVIRCYPRIEAVMQPLFRLFLSYQNVLSLQTVYTCQEKSLLLNATYCPLTYRNKLTGIIMVAHPVELHSNKKYLFDSIEVERKKISIEVHDWMGRHLSSIIHSLDLSLRVNREQIPESLREDLVKLRTRFQTAAMDMRNIIQDIHPYLIEKVGLLGALESYASRFEQIHHVKVYIFYQNKIIDLPKTAKMVIYRIVQEALSNMVKHSNATEVDIHFREDNSMLKIEIADNGDPVEGVVAGQGLWGMKERANLIGGDMIYSNTESGFTVALTIPLSKESERNE